MKGPFDKLFAWCIKPWVVAAFFLSIVLLFTYVDKPLAQLIYSYPQPTAAGFFSVLTLLGESKFSIGGLFLLALVLQYGVHKKQYALNTWFLWFCVLVPNLICLVLKISFGRARPSLLFENQAYGFYGLNFHAPYWSFPSGHTTTIMGITLGLCILFPRHGWAFLVTALLVVVSRVLLLQHYLSDVFIAAYLAIIEVGIVLFFFRRQACLASDV